MSAMDLSVGAPGVLVEGLTVATAEARLPVVQALSLAVGRGEFVGIAGETGSGKTTAGLALLGFLRAGLAVGGGSVRIGGEEMLGRSDRQLRARRGSLVAYVPQDPATALNPGLRVGDALGEVFRAHGRTDRAARDRRIAELFGALELPASRDFLRRFPHQLSGGQQQRVAIAVAFALKPAVVVMDEPTTGLDALTKVQVVALVKQLSRVEGSSVLFISHDMRLLLSSADRIVVLYAGRVVEEGPAGRIGADPRHPYTRALLSALPDPSREGLPSAPPGASPALSERGSGCDFAPRCGFAVPDCRLEVPPLVELDDARRARCLRLDEIRAAPEPRPDRPAPTRLPTPARPAVLEIAELSARYGGLPVTQGIGLRVEPGECVAIVGESGSGKTTLARCIAGLHDQYGGEIRLDGSPLAASVSRRSAAERRAIQYVFQNPYASLNPRRAVGRSIAVAAELLAGRSRREAMAEAAEAVALVGLRPDHLDALPHRLSGGERQRIALARALVARPRVLVCDEVTSSLDISVQAGIVTLLRGLQRAQGLAMLFITHDLALAATIADRVVVLKQGEVVEAGSAREIFSAPRHAYTRSLVALMA